MTATSTYTTPNHAETFRDLPELRAAVNESGSHFFDKDTMRFFASRVAPGLTGDRFFITSEKRCFDDYTREYRVRWVLRHDNGWLSVEDLYAPDADMTTYPDVPRYNTLAQARTAARNAARTYPAK